MNENVQIKKKKRVLLFQKYYIESSYVFATNYWEKGMERDGLVGKEMD